VIAVAAGHRQDTFDACHYIIDRVKQIAPIWKREVAPTVHPGWRGRSQCRGAVTYGWTEHPNEDRNRRRGRRCRRHGCLRAHDQRAGCEIVLIDANQRRAEGEAMDWCKARPSYACNRAARHYEDCSDAQVVVITAGAARSPGRLAWTW